MSKYKAFWEWIGKSDQAVFQMTFDEIRAITGFTIDHSFLTFKKELTPFGYEVGKISLKQQTVQFRRIDS